MQGDLVAAGGEVSIGGAVGDDLYAAGGEVQLDAIVSGNARVAGGDVTVGPATVVTGALTLSGGRIRFEGNTHDYLQATGGEVRDRRHRARRRRGARRGRARSVRQRGSAAS